MRIINTKTSETIGSVITNHSMGLAEACELAGVDLDEHDIDHLLLSVYTEAEEIAGAEECARESVKQGLVDGVVATDVDGGELAGRLTGGETATIPDGDYGWLMDKFGHVSHAMSRAYISEWNATLEAASTR